MRDACVEEKIIKRIKGTAAAVSSIGWMLAAATATTHKFIWNVNFIFIFGSLFRYFVYEEDESKEDIDDTDDDDDAAIAADNECIFHL